MIWVRDAICKWICQVRDSPFTKHVCSLTCVQYPTLFITDFVLFLEFGFHVWCGSSYLSVSWVLHCFTWPWQPNIVSSSVQQFIYMTPQCSSTSDKHECCINTKVLAYYPYADGLTIFGNAFVVYRSNKVQNVYKTHCLTGWHFLMTNWFSWISMSSLLQIV